MPTTYTITRANDASYDFTINLDAAFATATTIRWEIVPTEGEFPSASFSGTIDFDTSQTEQRVSTGIIRNHIFPRDFEIRLYDDADNTNTPLHTSGAQSVAGDSNLVGGNLVFAGGNDDNVLGLGFTDDVGSVTGGAGDDVLVITRFQYGDVSINDTDALIKFDFGVTITDYAERSVSSRGSTSILRVTLTLDTGAEIEITSPTRPGYSYQLGDSAMLDYGGFKAVIDARDTNDDSQLGPDSDYTYTIANPTPAPFVDDAPFSFGLSSYIFGVESGNTAISTLTATDSTSLMPVRYSIASGGDSALFSIDETSGALSLVNALDYATTAQKRYTLTVNAHADGDTVSTQVVVYLLEVGGDVSAAIGSLTFAGGSNDDIFVAASDNSLNATGGAGDDVLVITRFQYGTVSINETDALIKFDYEVTITDYAERSVSSRGSTSILLVTLTLDTGAEIEITSPTRPGYGYQLGDDAVLDYDAFKAAIKATGTNETSDLAGDYTVPDPSSAFDIITGDVSVFVDEGETGMLVKFKALLASDTTADVAYSITEGNADGVFRFEKNANGEFVLYLVSGKNLNYEDNSAPNPYELIVQLSAMGVTELREVTITVRDINDEVPVLADVSGVRTATIIENAVGADAGDISFTVTDADAGTSFDADSFTITGGTGTSDTTAGKFHVVRNGNNWDLQVRDTDDNGNQVSIDREADGTAGTINLNVKVDDGDNDSVVIPIVITVTDIDDGVPTRQVVSMGDAQIGEIAGSGVAPVGGKDANYRIAVTDPDTASGFTFDITADTPAGRMLAERFDFIKTGNEWALTLKAGKALDREDRTLFPSGSTITLKYTINDGAGNISDEYEVTLLVTDTNDNAPTVTVALAVPGTNGAVDERVAGDTGAITVTGLRITVSDADIGFDPTRVNMGLEANDFKLYNPDETENEDFEISGLSITGGVGTWVLRLKAGKALDYETTKTVSLKIGVDDGRNDVIITANAFTLTVNNLDDGTATYVVSGNVGMNARLEAMPVVGREDPDGVDSTVDVMYRWFTKSSTDLAPTSFDTTPTTTFQWLGAESTTNTYTITGAPVEGAQYGVLVGYQDKSLDTLSFVPVLASALKFGASSYTGSIDEDGKNITTIDIDATLDDSADDITYAFVTDSSGTTAARHLGFAIDSDGVITFPGPATDIDYDTDPRTDEITLTVRATYDNSDTNIPNPFSDVDVVVTINDLNDNPPTAKPSATTDALAEQSFSTHLPRKTGITFTIEDVDSVGSNTVMATDFVVYAGATGTTTDDRFEVVDLGGTWTLRLKANEELDYEAENADNDPSIILRVAINDGTHTPIPSDPITITVQNRNDQGTVAITRDTATKTLTATLTDDDGILTPADDSRAINPRYEWFDVATGERVGTDSNTLTYTDDNAHYRVRVEYNDVWNGANLVNRAETSTAPISLSPNFAQLLEHLTVLVVPVTARLSSDNSIIPTNELTLAFVLPDGTTATTYKGVTLANGRVMPASVDRLNYEALTPDEQANGIKFIVRATHDGNSVDIAFNVRVSNLPEVVSFGDHYTDYAKTIKLLDGKTISATETIHTATATADSNGAISYALTGTDAGLFNIDATSGAVTFKAETTVDSNTKDIYEFEVKATETGTSNTERQTVTIELSSIEIGPGQDAHSINNNDLGTSGSLLVAVITKVEVIGASAMVDWEITGGTDADLFILADRTGHGTNVKLNFGHADFVRKAEYKVKLTATNDVTMDTDDIEITLTINNFMEASPAIIPDRTEQQAEAHDPYDPDADPIAGLTPIPDTDPYAGS